MNLHIVAVAGVLVMFALETFQELMGDWVQLVVNMFITVSLLLTQMSMWAIFYNLITNSMKMDEAE